jgi:hypothetical protein
LTEIWVGALQALAVVGRRELICEVDPPFHTSVASPSSFIASAGTNPGTPDTSTGVVHAPPGASVEDITWSVLASCHAAVAVPLASMATRGVWLVLAEGTDADALHAPLGLRVAE